MKYADFLGMEPGEVFRPATVDEAVEVVVKSSEAGQAVIPWGGGMGQTYGYLPARADILLDLGGMNAVLAHEPGDLTVTVQGGVTIAEVQDALALHNQYLPLDPPQDDVATVGGVLATDAFGASRTGFGTARDWLIGLEVVDGRGRRVRGGGKVVKNVTGYDLPKLHTGALGTLGIIVEATFKVAPRPEATRVLLLTANALSSVARIHEETAPALSVLRETPAGRVLALIYTGYAEVADGAAESALAIAAEHGESPTGLPPDLPAPFTGILPETRLIARVTAPRARAMERHEALCATGHWFQVDTYPGVGVADLTLSEVADPEQAWRLLLEWGLRNRVGVTALHAPLEMRRDPSQVNLWSPLPPTLALQQRLKAALDPTRTLNPGRFIGGI